MLTPPAARGRASPACVTYRWAPLWKGRALRADRCLHKRLDAIDYKGNLRNCEGLENKVLVVGNSKDENEHFEGGVERGFGCEQSM